MTVHTDGSFDEAREGHKETGRTQAKVLPAGEPGVRIPRSCDAAKFWEVVEQCMQRADETNRLLGK